MNVTDSPDLIFEALEDLRLVVSYQPPAHPTDAEWDAWLSAVSAIAEKGQGFRLCVVTEGAHPSKSQMQRLAASKQRIERLAGKKHSEPLTAIVSPSPAVRFVASILTFTNPAIRCFSPSHQDDAFEHLGLSQAEGKRVSNRLERLRAGLLAHSTAA